MLLQSKWAKAWQNQQNNVCPAKTQISLVIRLVWSETLLCTKFVAQDPRLLHAYRKTDQTRQMSRLIWVFPWAHKSLVMSYSGSNFNFVYPSSFTVLFSRQLLICFDLIWATSWENLFYVICEQQRRRSACAFVQSDQHLCCSLLR